MREPTRWPSSRAARLPMPAQYPDAVRFRCEMLYCLERKTLKEIDAITEPSLSTLRRWKEEYNWDDKVKKRALSGPMLAQAVMEQINTIIQNANEEGRMLNPKETDQVAKLQKIASRHDKEARFTSHAIETMDPFNARLAENYPDLREQVTTPIMEFTTHLADQA